MTIFSPVSSVVSVRPRALTNDCAKERRSKNKNNNKPRKKKMKTKKIKKIIVNNLEFFVLFVHRLRVQRRRVRVDRVINQISYDPSRMCVTFFVNRIKCYGQTVFNGFVIIKFIVIVPRSFALFVLDSIFFSDSLRYNLKTQTVFFFLILTIAEYRLSDEGGLDGK